MYFAIICRDRPGALQTRLDTRPDHLAHLTDLNDRGILKFAGPLLGADEKPAGSLLVLETENATQAKELADADPYAKAGLFETVEIHPWNWVFNPPKEA